MRRESFPFPTMRQIVTGLDAARLPRRFKTTGEAFRQVDPRELQPRIDEKAIAVELEEERRKFVRQNQALARGRQKLRATRARLFATKVKNERLMTLRHQLQKGRWLGMEDATTQPVRRRERSFKEVKVRRG